MSDDEDTSVHTVVSDSEGGLLARWPSRCPSHLPTRRLCPVKDGSDCQSDQSSEDDEGSSCENSSKKQDAASEARELQQRREANIAAMLTNR